MIRALLRRKSKERRCRTYYAKQSILCRFLRKAEERKAITHGFPCWCERGWSGFIPRLEQ